jgi:hypothetical protein
VEEAMAFLLFCCRLEYLERHIRDRSYGLSSESRLYISKWDNAAAMDLGKLKEAKANDMVESEICELHDHVDGGVRKYQGSI